MWWCHSGNSLSASDPRRPHPLYKGMPLYFFFKDANAGDTTGQGINNVWYVVAP
jgi:predicted lipoprotein with Yx(FWY)xxD motif